MMQMRPARRRVPTFLPPIPRYGLIIGVDGAEPMAGPNGTTLDVRLIEPTWRADTRGPGWVFEHVHLTGRWSEGDRGPLVLTGPRLDGMPLWLHTVIQANWPGERR